jgi:activator of HSP90 ATPase
MSETRTETIHVVGHVPAKPRAVYDAWIDGESHAAMTGSPAASEAREGGRFDAWDGYITGTHLELRGPKRVVQTWRTTEFSAKTPDSKLIVLFEPEQDGTRVTIVHTDIPRGQGAQYEQGWKDHYLRPMARFFRKRREARKSKRGK